MKLKRTLLLFLAITLCFGLVACNSNEEEDPKILPKDLAAMTDEELIPVLLASYDDYTEPAVFSAQMSWLYRSGESVLAKMEGTIRSNGIDRMLERTYSVEATTKSESYIYYNGVCYVNDGTKTKSEGKNTDVFAYFESLYPKFGKVSDYNFVAKDLLRSEDESYSLVLYLPANSIADSADIVSPLTAAGNETPPVTMSDFSDIYLTLRFSPDGKLMGQTLGFDCKMNADGVVTDGSVLFRFDITSTDPAQGVVSAPDDASAYMQTDDNPFTPTTGSETDDAADSVTNEEDTSSDEE